MLGEVPPSHRPHEEMYRQEVRGRAPEATYASPQGTQYFSMVHEAESGAEVHQQMGEGRSHATLTGRGRRRELVTWSII